MKYKSKQQPSLRQKDELFHNMWFELYYRHNTDALIPHTDLFLSLLFNETTDSGRYDKDYQEQGYNDN